MKLGAYIFGVSAMAFVGASAADYPRISDSFDAGWRFLKSDAAGAEQPAFDDAAWRKVDLPHDWSIEGPFAQSNPTGGAGAFLPSGIAWYRKHFSAPANSPARRVFVEFDGVMANSDVWINGFKLGHRPYGYVSFQYELTGHLNSGTNQNILAVRADTSAEPASRWYTGAGIYRHVRLLVTDPVQVEQWGLFVTTPKVSAAEAAVHLQTTVTNQTDSPAEVFLSAFLTDSKGRDAGAANTAAQSIAARGIARFDQDIVVKTPELWNLDQPAIYQARVEVRARETILDVDSVSFGIRDAKFEAATGFWLNGKNIKIYGVCLHHDGGAFGAAVPLSVWRDRLAALKEAGCNAIRTAHDPPDPGFLDLCDRMGFLVMDEMFDCWTVAKNRFDYHLYFNDWSAVDTRDTVLRDRNHPSVVLYSAGNEIHDTPNAALSKRILSGLIGVFHENDPTRPVTQALFRPNTSRDYDDGLADLLDVIGTNYRDSELLAAQKQNPKRIILGTENNQDRRSWLYLRDSPSYCGQFLWSGIDYLGESRQWPVIAAASGLLDRTGAIKASARERESWWIGKPVVFITRRTAEAAASPTDPGYELAQQDVLRRPQVVVADWTPSNLAAHPENVEVYSNCKEVELLLNGKSLGSKPLNADASPRNWRVSFEPGTIRAVGRDGPVYAGTDELRTAGKPAKILLTANQSTLPFDWDDVCRVGAVVVDEKGVPAPGASDMVEFEVSGPGVIAAVDNADNSSHDAFQASRRRAYQGRCVAFVRASAPSGSIVLTASAPGLRSGSIEIKAVKGN